MEFLRFGSQIPGASIGCCAMDVIQGFNVDPDTKHAIQLVYGDGGMPVMRGDKQLFAGPTYKDIFLSRLRTGTFDTRDLPNHGFLAVITEGQLRGENGRKWLKILHEQGFEFVRAVDNSVYSYEVRKNYLFALFRNAKPRGIDPNAPPKAWTDLGENTKTQEELWAALAKPKFLTEEECREAGAPMYNAGKAGTISPRPEKKEDEPKKPTPWELTTKAVPA